MPVECKGVATYLRDICGGAFDEDVLRREGYLGVITVDDRRQREHNPFRVFDDWVHGRIANDVEEFLNFGVCARTVQRTARRVLATSGADELSHTMVIELHQLGATHLVHLVQRLELELIRR
eukprot:SAG11_NODE_735_length_7452_cov_26.426629_4_plen_122_part_00